MRKILWTKIILDHWSRCSRLLMTKVSWRNACSTILRSKPPMIKSIKKKAKQRCNLKALRKQLRLANLKKKDSILHKKKTISKRKFSMTIRKNLTSSLRSKAQLTTWLMETILLFSKVKHLRTSNIKRGQIQETISPIRHRLRVIR